MKHFVILMTVLVLAFMMAACANDAQCRSLDYTEKIQQVNS